MIINHNDPGAISQVSIHWFEGMLPKGYIEREHYRLAGSGRYWTWELVEL